MQQATLNSPVINFKKERNFSEKLNVTFAFLSQNFRPIGKNLLLIAGPFALLVGIFYGVYQTYTMGFGFNTSGTNPWETAGSFSYLILSFIGMIVFSFIATTLVVAIVMRHIQTYIEEGHTNLPTARLWSTIWSDFFHVLGTTFYIFALFVVSLLLFAVPITIASIGGSPNPVAIGLLMFFGFFGLMFFWPSLLLLYPIRSMERKDIISATGRLFKLNSGKWLSTMGLVMVVAIIQSVISMVFAVPMYVMMFMQAMHTQEERFTTGALSLNNILLTFTSGISMLGSFALYSLLFIALTFQYFNLLERKEARGLLERMESFGKQKPDIDDHEEQY